jgi:glucosamine--fructose-6-phosphate aminotransferase (isomerizing)
MCGIFGYIGDEFVSKEKLKRLVEHSRQRGRDSSGLIYSSDEGYQVNRADFDIKRLLKKISPYKSNVVLGHSRLITNGLADNQPVVRNGICVIHNGIIVNDDSLWKEMGAKRLLEIDSEVIAAITEGYLEKHGNVDGLAQEVLKLCQGVVACAIAIPAIGKLVLFSNNGSLYFGNVEGGTYFSSESYPLKDIGCENIEQVREEQVVFDIAKSDKLVVTNEKKVRTDLIPPFQFVASEEEMLEYKLPEIKRCTKCILPETMPYISFDDEGVCNYCNNYSLRNVPKPKKELFELVEPYRRSGEVDCIVPFSGGRDSCYGDSVDPDHAEQSAAV